MKKIAKSILFSVISVIMSVNIMFSFCACGATNSFRPDNTTVSIHTDKQKQYLEKDYDSIVLFADGMSELSRPNPVSFSWDKSVAASALEISASEDFSDCQKYDVEGESCEIYNLAIGTEYFWRLTDKDGTVYESRKFTTENTAPRNLYIDGVTNVRDLGGWDLTDGRRVKQGMIYRCGRLNKSNTADVNIEITANGIDVMRNRLGIKSEIDLRTVGGDDNENGGLTSSPLGKDINYYSVPMYWNLSAGINYLTDSDSRIQIRKMFELLADERNYPLIFHCNIGTDRTGLYSFLINALLGVKINDLYRDYLFSNFGNIGGSRQPSGLKELIDTVITFEGSTFAQKTENCLLDMGVKLEQITFLRNLLTEK